MQDASRQAFITLQHSDVGVWSSSDLNKHVEQGPVILKYRRAGKARF